MQLIITEKPSVARSIVSVLGAAHKRDGFIESDGYVISWCAGHLLEPATPDSYDKKYDKWRYTDLPIIPRDWKYTAAKGKEKQLNILSALMNRADVDTVINSCDAGREGENIFRLVYEYAKCTKPVQRLWISSMEDAAIRAGFKNLRDGADYDTLYQSALCRSQADWLVGINMTRTFSCLYRGATLHVGRVQTPTLAMIVERGEKIAAFQKEKFYIVELDMNGFKAVSGRMDDKETADALRAVCDNGGAAVKTLERTEKTVHPPKLYDLTTLQREANRLFGYTAQQTLDCVQALYEKGFCTYPRTDSRYITGDMQDGIPALVNAVAAAMPFFGEIDLPVSADIIVNADKVGDHHALLPTARIVSADLAVMPTAERNILTMIAARLLCAVGEKHVYTEIRAELECGNGVFTAKSRTVKTDGWKSVDSVFRAMVKAKPDEDGEHNNELPGGDRLPPLERAQVVRPVIASVSERFTSPPKPYTEDTLLSGMECAGTEDFSDTEKGGLGTPATRANIIEKLVKAGFIERQKKNLIATELGRNLIAVLPDTLKSPALTAQWEERLAQVERGELAATDFMAGIEEMTRSLVAANSAPKSEYASLFAPTPKGDVIGVCSRCGAPVREGAKGFFCDNPACGFKLWKNSKFWTAKKKPLTAAIVAALLKEGRVFISGLYSEKTGKEYDATVVLDDPGSGYFNFKLDFTNGRKKR